MKKSTYSKVISLVILTAMLLSMLPLTSFSAVTETITETISMPTLDEMMEANSPELVELMAFAEGQTPGYGSNGKFLAPIEAPNPNAIKIYNAQDLDNIRNNLSGSYVLMNDIDLSGFNDGQWMPIGDYSPTSNRFTGIFDGQGHVIRSLTITDNKQYAGLFGYSSGATIINVGLENIHIDISLPSGSVYAGSISGYSSSCSISNCYSTGIILSSSFSSHSYSGGIYGYGSNVQLSNSYNTGRISTASSSSTSNWPVYAGGLFGYSSYVGGSSINCYNTGDVFSSSNSDSYSGGIGAYNPGLISNCNNIGNITASLSSNKSGNFVYAGGICASGSGSTSNCYNTGIIISKANDSTLNAYSYAGGIHATSTHANIFSCYNAGDVFAATDYTFAYSGGICGQLGLSDTNIYNCYNTGDINALSSRNMGYAGGICGYSYNTISNCYSEGNISSFASPLSSLPYYSPYAGGICGYNVSYGSISNCIVLSNRIYAENTNIPANIRCYTIGYDGVKTNNLAINGISGDVTDDSDRRISSSEARSRATYINLGWDFDNVWEMVPGYDYPQLRDISSGGTGDTLLDFYLSTTKLDLSVGQVGIVEVAPNPKVGLKFTAPPTLTITQAGEIISINGNEIEEIRNNGYRYYIEGLNAGEANIEVSVSYANSPSDGIATFPDTSPIIPPPENVLTTVSNGDSVEVKGIISYEKLDGSTARLKHHPVYLKSSVDDTPIGYAKTNGNGELNTTIDINKYRSVDIYYCIPATYNNDISIHRNTLFNYSTDPMDYDISIWTGTGTSNDARRIMTYEGSPITPTRVQEEIDHNRYQWYTIGYNAPNIIISKTDTVAFAMMDTLITGTKYWNEKIDAALSPLVPLRVYYDTGGKTQEVNDIDWQWNYGARKWFNRFGDLQRNIMHINPTRVFRERTLLHELGHAIFNNYSRNGKGGDHYFDGFCSNETAYSEGWADFYVHAVLGSDKINSIDDDGDIWLDCLDVASPAIDNRNLVCTCGQGHTSTGSYHGLDKLKPKVENRTTVYNEYASASIFWDIFKWYKNKSNEADAINALARALSEKNPNSSGNPNMFEFYSRLDSNDKNQLWRSVFRDYDSVVSGVKGGNKQGFMDMDLPDGVTIDSFNNTDGTIRIEVNAKDDTGLGRIDLFEGDIHLDFLTTFFIFPLVYNYKPIYPGSHNLTARIYDLAGNEATITPQMLKNGGIASSAIQFKPEAAAAEYEYRKQHPSINSYSQPFTEIESTVYSMYAPNSSVFDTDCYIKSLLKSNGARVAVITSENDLNAIKQDLYRYEIIVLANGITSNLDNLKDYINDGGILFVTAESGDFLTRNFSGIFDSANINHDERITTNDKGLKTMVGGSILNDVVLSDDAIGFTNSIKYQAIASQGEAVVCALTDYGFGRIIYVPFSLDAERNQLLDYAISIAETDFMRKGAKGAFSSEKHSIGDSYSIMLEAGGSRTYVITKGIDDLFIANVRYIPELKVEVFTPEGSPYELDSNWEYLSVNRLCGEAGTWTVKVINEADAALITSLFVSKPMLQFDNLDIVYDGSIYTNQQTFILSGTSSIFDSLTLEIGHDDDFSTKTISIVNGIFSADIKLEHGLNKLLIKAANDNGDEYYLPFWVFYETNSPVLNVVSSQDIAFEDEYQLVLASDKRCVVTVNGVKSAESSDSVGTPMYAFDTTLKTGENVFNVVATDFAGNVTTTQVTIIRSEKTAHENAPIIAGFSVPNNKIITENMVVDVFIESESEYTMRAWLDNNEMDVTDNEINITLNGIINGRHSLICRATDEWGNSTQAAITIFVDKEAEDGFSISGKIKSYNPNKPITIRLINTEDEFTYEETIKGIGGYGQVEQEFTIKGVVPGKYDLVIIKDAHTKFTVKNMEVSNDNVDLSEDIRPEVQLMTLRCGDINGDGLINDADLTLLWRAGNYNRKADEAENDWCDLNGDGLINDADLTILWLAYNYNRGPVIIE